MSLITAGRPAGGSGSANPLSGMITSLANINLEYCVIRYGYERGVKR